MSHVNEPRSHDLQDFMEQVSVELRQEYERITRRSREDPGTAGDESEAHWRNILAGWLPAALPVVTKGRILSEDGTSSPQVDVLVLHPGYPEKLRDKKQYLAGGVIAAFECKLTLRKRDLAKIAETARIIRGLVRTRNDSLYSTLHSPISFGVLAHSSEWSKLSNGLPDGDDLRFELKARQVDLSLQQILEGDSHPREALDVICISDLACWTRFVSVASPAMWPNRELWNASRKLYQWSDGGVVHDQYSRWARGAPEWDGPPNPLYVLISKMLRRISWELSDYRAFAEYWLLAKMPGQSGGSGAVRNWELDVLGDIAQRARAGKLTGGNRWDPWGSTFY